MDLGNQLKGEKISLTEMLEARDIRVAKQKALLEQHDATLICFTMNIPGEVKVFPLASRAFEEGNRLIVQQLERYGHKQTSYSEEIEKTGYTAYYCVMADAEKLKAQMSAIEESCALSRIFDIDVITKNGKLFRMNERSCFICDCRAFDCARSRKHTVPELLKKINSIISEYFITSFFDKVTNLVQKALLYEVSLTPKPGLVDMANSGAHSDMDYSHFIESIAVLGPFFRRFAEQGYHSKELSPTVLMEKLRYPGMLAENAMFSATKSVNTHKGAIFSLGLICAALGYLYQPERFGAICRNHLFSLCKEMAENLVVNELERGTQSIDTAGKRAFAEHQVNGARGEAASGFQTVRNFGLPLLKTDANLQKSGLTALLCLITHTDDTNILKRGGVESLRYAKKYANDILTKYNNEDAFDVFKKRIEKMDHDFIKRNLSPGGSADLLAIAFFLLFLEDDSVISCALDDEPDLSYNAIL